MNNPILSYEESVRWLRAQPEMAKLVRACYLDKDNAAAAQRFRNSEEFVAVCELFSIAGATQPLKILDLGCGNGIVTFAFASLGQHTTALDPDPSDDVGLGAAERLRRQFPELGERIEIKQGVAEELPFASETFDAIYTRQAVHHFRSLPKAFAECHRVLKAGGRFLATREHIVDDAKQMETFLANHALHYLHGGENAHSLDNYLINLENSGFKLRKHLRSYDSVINHFPLSNEDIRVAAKNAIQRKFGGLIARWLGGLPSTENLFRFYLSRRDHTPGRLATFLLEKTV